MSFATLIGFTAGTLTTLSFVPQVAKTYRTKRCDDLSAGMLLAFTSGVVLWLVRSPRSAWTAGAVLVVVVSAYFVVISAGPEAASRFRVPLAPLLAILAAAGWESLRKTRLQRQSAPIVGAARNPTS